MPATLSSPPQPPPVTWGFLALPAELRCQVYLYCTPVHKYARDVRNLALTCRQVREEYIVEVARPVKRLLKDMHERLRGQQPQRARIMIPESLDALTRLTVEFPLSTGDPTGIDPGILVLLGLHLSELTIQLRAISEEGDEDNDPGWGPCEFLRDLDFWFNGPGHWGPVARAMHGVEADKYGTVERGPVRTKSIVILWGHPPISRSLADERHQHYYECYYTHNFMRRETAKSKAGEHAITTFGLDDIGRIELKWASVDM